MTDNVIEITGKIRSPFDKYQPRPAHRGVTMVEQAAEEGYHAGYEDGWQRGVDDARLTRTLIVVAAFLCGVFAVIAVERWL